MILKNYFNKFCKLFSLKVKVTVLICLLWEKEMHRSKPNQRQPNTIILWIPNISLQIETYEEKKVFWHDWTNLEQEPCGKEPW